jgi:RNA polymerase sigma-70 factor (ECF subfamily)
VAVRAIRTLIPSAAGALRQERAEPMDCEDEVANLFLEARDEVYRYLVSLGVRPPQAQECTQEAFLRLYATLKKGHTVENPRAWTFRVAHNIGVRIRQDESSNTPFNPRLEMQLPDPAPNPEEILTEQEWRSQIRASVAALSEQQRHCLYLRAEGFRYREIASIMGVSDSTVGEFLRRAMTRLKRMLNA